MKTAYKNLFKPILLLKLLILLFADGCRSLGGNMISYPWPNFAVEKTPNFFTPTHCRFCGWSNPIIQTTVEEIEEEIQDINNYKAIQSQKKSAKASSKKERVDKSDYIWKLIS